MLGGCGRGEAWEAARTQKSGPFKSAQNRKLSESDGYLLVRRFAEGFFQASQASESLADCELCWGAEIPNSNPNSDFCREAGADCELVLGGEIPNSHPNSKFSREAGTDCEFSELLRCPTQIPTQIFAGRQGSFLS